MTDSLVLIKYKRCMQTHACLCVCLYFFSTTTQAVVPQKYLGKPLPLDLTIISLSKSIDSGRLSKQALADFYWQRGRHFATLRQHVSAIADFTETLTYAPDSIKAYVSRAISFARIEQYQEAFTDLSLAEKLNPRHELVYAVRGGLNYYLRRYLQAVDDYKNYLILRPADMYRMIWLHLSEKKLNAIGETSLARRFNKARREEWPGAMIEVFLGELAPENLVAALEKKDQVRDSGLLCEAYFYLGQYYLLRKNNQLAQRYFNQALNTGASDYVEYEFAKAFLTEAY